MGLLQLAVNSSSAATASAALHHLPDVLEAASAGKLLATAAVRRHFALVADMTALPAVRQSVHAAALGIVLTHILLADVDIQLDEVDRWRALSTVVHMIAEQRLAMQQLDVSTVARLLQAFIITWSFVWQEKSHVLAAGVALLMCKMARGNEWYELLLAAVEVRAGCLVWRWAHTCYEVPAGGRVVVYIGSLPLLLAAVESGDKEFISEFCEPGAGCLFRGDLLQLLQVDAKHCVHFSAGVLCNAYQRAAQQLSGDDVVDLLRRATTSLNPGFISAISHLPACRKLDSDIVEQLMLEAQQHGANLCRYAIQQLLR
jgi:hypothetical protein